MRLNSLLQYIWSSLVFVIVSVWSIFQCTKLSVVMLVLQSVLSLLSITWHQQEQMEISRTNQPLKITLPYKLLYHIHVFLFMFTAQGATSGQTKFIIFTFVFSGRQKTSVHLPACTLGNVTQSKGMKLIRNETKQFLVQCLAVWQCKYHG